MQNQRRREAQSPVSSLTLTFSARNWRHTKSARSANLVIRTWMNLCTKVFELVSQRLRASTARMHTTNTVPGGRSAATSEMAQETASCRPRPRTPDDHPLVCEQRRAEQFGELAGADLTGTQPVDRDVLGARLLRTPRSTTDTARSTSSSSSPSTNCRRAASSLTPRSCHVRPTDPTPSTPVRPRCIAYADPCPAPAPQHHHSESRRRDRDNTQKPDGTASDAPGIFAAQANP